MLLKWGRDDGPPQDGPVPWTSDPIVGPENGSFRAYAPWTGTVRSRWRFANVTAPSDHRHRSG